MLRSVGKEGGIPWKREGGRIEGPREKGHGGLEDRREVSGSIWVRFRGGGGY